jgi:hypothetical protein
MTLILSNIVYSFTSTNKSGSAHLGQCNISSEYGSISTKSRLISDWKLDVPRTLRKNCGGNALFPTEIGDRA